MRVKMGRAFVDRLGIDPHHAALVAAVVGTIVAIANDRGRDLTDEGVEDQYRLASLRKLGCPRSQAFDHAPTIPATDTDHHRRVTPLASRVIC